MGNHYIHPGKDTRTPEQKREDERRLTGNTHPNIRTVEDEHAQCWRNRYVDGERYYIPGDVRYCKHGKVQLLIKPERARLVGPGSWQWSTISQFWNPVKYRKAIAALEGR